MKKSELFLERFFHRRDDFALQVQNQEGGWYYQRQRRAVTEKDVALHLQHRHTLATYPVNENTSTFLVIDVDIRKGYDPNQWWDKASETAFAVAKIVQNFFGKKRQLLSASGGRGFHIWVWFQQPLSSGKIKAMGEYICSQIKKQFDAISTEVYPRQAAVFQGVGNCVKVPMGIHQKTGQLTDFLDVDLYSYEYDDQWTKLAEIQPIPADIFHKIWHKYGLKEETIKEGENGGLPCIKNLIKEGPYSGGRAVSMFYLALNLVHSGLTTDYIVPIMESVNKKGAKPLGREDITKAIESATARGYSRFPCKRKEMDHYCVSSCPFFGNKRKQRKEKTISRE